MEPVEDESAMGKLRAIRGGRKSWSVGGAIGNLAACALGVLALLVICAAVLGGVWVVEQLWNAVS